MVADMCMAYDGGMEDILVTLEDSDHKLRLPTLTLYTGERLDTPPVNLHLSLGGSYTTTSDHADNNNILNTSEVMKRSYLEQNNQEMMMMPGTREQEEIILIDDNNINHVAAAGGTGSAQKYYNSNHHSTTDNATAHPDIDWAARSASGNRALLRALHIIKSESSSSSNSTTTHHKRTTRTTHQGAGAGGGDVVFQLQEEEPAGAVATGNCMNPDDFLSMSPTSTSNNFCAVNNVDVYNAFKKEKNISITSSASSYPTNPAENHHHDDKGKSISVLPAGAAPPIPNYYYYGTRGEGKLMTTNNFSTRNITNAVPINIPQGAILGSRISAPPSITTPSLSSNSYPPALMAPMIMRYHHDTCMTSPSTAATQPPLPPPPPAAGSNQWSNAGYPLMKRNEYLRDSEIDMIRDMPTVATDGGIPDGRKIEGFLYRYSKYEDVIIVCFCHGSFFSPKEFVMHAAGGAATQQDYEFQNPMRLITIVPVLKNS